MAQRVVVLCINHEEEAVPILHTGGIAQVVAILRGHLLPIPGQYGLHRRQTVAEVIQEQVYESQVPVHRLLQPELSKRCLKVVADLGHPHRLVGEEARATIHLRCRAAVIHVVADAVAATTKTAHHHRLGRRGVAIRPSVVGHLDAGAHFCRERRIVGRCVAYRGIVGCALHILEHQEGRHTGLRPGGVGVGRRHGDCLIGNNGSIAPARGGIERCHDASLLGHLLQGTHVLLTHLCPCGLPLLSGHTDASLSGIIARSGIVLRLLRIADGPWGGRVL